MINAMVAQDERGWVDVVAVQDESRGAAYTDNVCVIWPGEEASQIIGSFNDVIGDRNTDTDPSNDVDPAEFGLSSPLTVAEMWTHMTALGDLLHTLSAGEQEVIAHGY